MNLILLRFSELEDGNSSSAHESCTGNSPKRHKGTANHAAAPTKVVHLKGTDARARHIAQHLRKRTGDRVSVGIINGSKGKAIVNVDDTSDKDEGESTKKNKGGANVTLELTFDPNANCPTQQPEMTLILAIPQPKRLQKLWSVISQMGVTRIILIRAKLSPFGTHCQSTKFNEETYRALIEEGMAQGAHTREVRVDVEVDEVISPAVLQRLGLSRNDNDDDDNNAKCQARLFLDCGDESGMVVPPARDAVMLACASSDANANEVHVAASVPPSAVLAIGPERGWTEEEARLFQDVGGFRMASLGPSILRVDVAVVAGLAVVSAALDEADSSP
mmetsp:Transcript_25872/g.74815  ORF Transcript_25872/g.74815 Transcript_25872/m.74815 type:complete len:333 (+) Transcript_25872:98-1096(+)